MITMVTVTYADRLKFLAESVRRALADEGVDRVLVVSNASRSPLEELERAWGERVRVIRLPANTGSANGYAVGIQAALDDGADYLWLMDDDNAPQPGALKALLAARDKLAASRPLDNFALLSSRSNYQSDILAGYTLHHSLPKPGTFSGFHLLDLPHKIWCRTPWGKPAPPEVLPELIPRRHATYGGFFCHRSVFERIGLPKVELVLYEDDTELTARLTNQGGAIFLVTGSLVEDLEPTWRDKAKFGSCLSALLCAPGDLRAFYSTRNQTYIEEKLSRHKPWQSINRRTYVAIMFVMAMRYGRWARYRILRDAMKQGRAGKLGLDKRFPLS
jgi:GT2 family glycosyltransferase